LLKETKDVTTHDTLCTVYGFMVTQCDDCVDAIKCVLKFDGWSLLI